MRVGKLRVYVFWGGVSTLTTVIRAVFPERLPFSEIERHAAFGVDDHREQRLICGGVEKLGSRVAFWVGWDVQEFGWTWRCG